MHSKWGFPRIRGTFFGGPHNKEYSIWGSILGSPYFGKVPDRGATCKTQKNFDPEVRLGAAV